jgi:hypothetical protein
MRNTNEIETAQKNQLEFGLAGKRSQGRARERRVQRANWWFSRMRQAVAGAVDWQSTPPAQPEQAYLTLAGRRN